jgi:uncharacterized repeat protein (TIGR03803 family)
MSGGVVQGRDGNFYGTTFSGGASPNCNLAGGCGTVYKVTPQGVLTTLHSFDGNDGGFSYVGLVLGEDGEFYGTTTYGEPNNAGTIFKISADGKFTNLYSFCARRGLISIKFARHYNRPTPAICAERRKSLSSVARGSVSRRASSK